MNRLLLIAAISVFAVSGYAQDYPSRAINLIVPNPPGGMNQIHAQPLGAVLEKLYKQPAPVLNKPGAMVMTRIFDEASSRAIGSVMPTTPPLDAE